MKKLGALTLLLWRFASAMLTSAWTTSVTIVTASDAPHRNFASFSYGELREPGALLLGAMVSLTPGTSLVNVDTERRELVLHILDTQDLDATLATIRHQFLEPIHVVFGERS